MDDVIEFLMSYTVGKNGFVIELFVCEALFILPAPCRKYPWLRIPLCVIAYFAYGFFCPYVPVVPYFRPILTCLLIFALSVVLQLICFSVSVKRIVFDSSAAYILQNLTLNVKELFLILTGLSGPAGFFAGLLIAVAMLVVVYLTLVRRTRRSEMRMDSMWVTVASLSSIFVCNVMFTFLNMEGLGATVYVKILFIVCCTLAMLFQFSVFRSEQQRNERIITEQLLAKEQKRHRMSQENIDLINIKCHDLKKQISLLKKGSDPNNEDAFRDVEEAVMLYGETIKTGNENLDLILTEKQLYCKKYEIRIEVIAEGSVLDFMSPADVYSLFGNAVDNAIESVMKSEAPKRIINIAVRRKGDMACATVTNWCGEAVSFKNALPVTSKSDTAYHGFGTLSMRYVAEKYHGNVVFDVENNIFSVNIMIPVPCDRDGKRDRAG